MKKPQSLTIEVMDKLRYIDLNELTEEKLRCVDLLSCLKNALMRRSYEHITEESNTTKSDEL